ncbi:MAG: 4-hydroxy-3-methylbut-2-enyl diphosphate reductase [candidate division Zixibacteria bacterium]|nr:4-hydroxy-3-methylbut-2-enyl diphosphate reductase [candidate division Zixibacteria bacterium]
MIKEIIMAKHHGFCMGVKRAINIAEETAENSDEKVTILNEIVHNESVVEKFREQGVKQAFSVEDVEGGTLIISAHGIAPDVIKRAEEQGLKVIDATCPLVTRIYDIIVKAVENGFHIIHYGEADHDETYGVVGYAPDKITVVSDKESLMALPDWEDRKLGLTVQTTAHEKEFEEAEKLALVKWPHIKVFNTICNATTKRQQAILELAPNVDMVLVVGSETSANSNRLAQISDVICGRGILISSVDDIKDEWFEDKYEKIGISAGASTPDYLVEAVIERLVELSGGTANVVLPEKRTKIARVAR